MQNLSQDGVQAGVGREFRVVAAERDRQQRGRSRARQEEYTDTYRNIRHTVRQHQH